MSNTGSYAIYPSLKDRSVFITGGGTGIGASLVTHFAAQGSKVTFVDIAVEPSQELAVEIAQRGDPRPLFIECDLRDIDALRDAIDKAGRVNGPITVLVRQQCRQ